MTKIAEQLGSPQRRSRVTIQNQEMTVVKEMFLDVDGKQVEMEMIIVVKTFYVFLNKTRFLCSLFLNVFFFIISPTCRFITY